MIHGLRLLAWVQWRRGWDAERAAQKGIDSRTAEKFADCDFCMENTTETTRRAYHCGFLPRAQWIGDGHSELSNRLPAGRDLETDVCPGYLIRRSEVLEASRALAWAERGLVRDFYHGGELTDLALDAVDILAGERQAASSYAIHESVRAAKQERR